MSNYKEKEIQKILRFSKLKHEDSYTSNDIKRVLKSCENIENKNNSINKDKELEWQEVSEISEFWQNQMIELLKKAENDHAELVRFYRQVVIKKRDDEIQELKEKIKKMIKIEQEQKTKIIGQNRKIIKLNRELESLKRTKNTDKLKGAENA
ncbi:MULTISPECIES: hypothetical protein [Helicobacter]|uniref:DUF3972 domain-containing protein n=1 Tax=Helicobacter bilis ATCC 43879 TaxID=613026 RepID=C3XFN2_9HELI|nr:MULTISPECIES: hypothetical protein [Helicobacter]EEO23821.1 hypothetical protein HRAG_00878 [Helicobacter bilis ATCC 43879]